MRKIKGQGKLTKLFASKIAAYNKSVFTKYISKGENLKHLCEGLNINQSIHLQVVSFSSTYDFSEQVLSILSFIKYAGQPVSWTVYSDGTHSKTQISLLELSFSFIKVVCIENFESYIGKNINSALLPYKKELIAYAKVVPLGKRMFFYLNFDIAQPTLFIDSDIIFYEKAKFLKPLINENYNGWFLPDSDWGCLDSRYKSLQTPQPYQVNGGMFLINKNLKYLPTGMDFFCSLGNKYEYFSDQNVFHILLLANGFMPFDPRIFVLDSGDQFDIAYSHKVEEMAVRHYTGPVRHKMWQRDWKWHLSL